MGCECLCSTGSFAILNFLLWLVAGLMLALGIIGIVDPSSVEQLFSHVIASDRLVYLDGAGAEIRDIVWGDSIYMVVMGGASLFIATFGLFITCCCVKMCPMFSYAVMMLPVWFAEIALVVFPAPYGYSVQLTIRDNMALTLKHGFYHDITVDGNGTVTLPDGKVDASWATLQLKEGCCGGYNYTDYRQFDWEAGTFKVVPQSCCVQTIDSVYPAAVRFTNVQKCQQGEQAYIYQKNCYVAISGDIERFTQHHKGIAGGLAAGTSVIQIALIIMAMILAKRVQREYFRLNKRATKAFCLNLPEAMLDM